MNLKEKILQENIKVPEDFFDNVRIYKEHLKKWNKIHNLTGARDENVIDDFIYDALFAVTFLPSVRNILDIGSGAGFPGMILAFALPDTDVTLVEPMAKRASFLHFVKSTLGLKNVSVVKKRVEDMQPVVFELITSRAVTDTSMLLKLSKNFRDENTLLLFYKGEKVYDEVDGSMRYEIIKHLNRHYLLMGEKI